MFYIFSLVAKYSSLLHKSDGTPGRVFVPFCGKTVDMKV